MDERIDAFWALQAGSLLLAAHLGVVLLVEGRTRRRTVSSGVARHVVGAAATTVGVAAADYVGSGADGSLLMVRIAAAMLVSAIALASSAERATLRAHIVVGAAIGAVIMPLSWQALAPQGVLGQIRFGDTTFIDGGAATFTLAGWFALIGAIVIGPRLGRVGPQAQLRVIPGSSSTNASVGALLVAGGAVGLFALPIPVWSDAITSGSTAVLIGSATAALTAAAVDRAMAGTISTAVVVRGLLGGAIATLGAVSTRPGEAVLLGVVGGLIGFLAHRAVEQRKIDDPIGIGAIAVSCGTWGSIAAAGLDVDQVLSQLVGQLVIAVWSIVSAAAIFGALRMARLLRLPPELEVVGLDD